MQALLSTEERKKKASGVKRVRDGNCLGLCKGGSGGNDDWFGILSRLNILDSISSNFGRPITANRPLLIVDNLASGPQRKKEA